MPIDKSIDYSAITPEIKALTKLCLADNVIEPEMYVKYAVNRGLRDLNGNGVLTGLTEISEIQSSKMVDGEKVPCEGKLFYRGVDVEQIVSGFIREKRYGCCFSKRMRKVFKKNEKSMLQFCNKNSKKKRAFTMG